MSESAGSRPELVERILERCVRTARGCLEWQGGRVSGKNGRPGHGRVRYKGKLLLPHRVVLEEALGRRLPDDILACHECDNPPCCEVSHLFPGTYADNAKDAYDKGRMAAPLSSGAAVAASNDRRWAAWREKRAAELGVDAAVLKPPIKCPASECHSTRPVKWGSETMSGAELGRRLDLRRQEIHKLVRKGWFPLDDTAIRETQARVDRIIAEHRS